MNCIRYTFSPRHLLTSIVSVFPAMLRGFTISLDTGCEGILAQVGCTTEGVSMDKQILNFSVIQMNTWIFCVCVLRS